MIYTIQEGKHYSDQFIDKITSIFFQDELSYKIEFYKSTIYQDTTVDRFNINKLFGFSRLLHHHNSYRFGWNCEDNNDTIQIHYYCHINKEVKSGKICSLKINSENILGIKVYNNIAVFKVNNLYSTINIIKKPSIGYKLFPYFGGNKTAPHDIMINLVQIK